MKIIESSFSDFVKTVKTNNLQIVCYGTGFVGLSIEDIFVQTNISANVHCFVDSDESKSNSSIKIFGRTVNVISLDNFKKQYIPKKVLLITASMFDAIIVKLNNYIEFDEMECYIFAKLNCSYIKESLANGSISRTDNKNAKIINKIPKLIHYCWFGGGIIPTLIQQCISSWSKYNPGYEIIKWDESNYDVYKNNYMKQAHLSKKWAFVSDYARLDVLYNYGGIYFDTDVEVLRNLDGLLYNTAFIGYNEWPFVNSAISGCVPKFHLIKMMRDIPRSKKNFIQTDGSYDMTINSIYESDVLKKFGFVKNYTFQNIEGMIIYPPCFFPQIGATGANADIEDCTYAVHHAVGSWKQK
jgi:hypothetical protein